ncbi:MarR family winged helix-turn-helix transcriptional regulator [Antarctobacter jejuensis]|uniref:MarR family winged helix-turn-helix transcriptional regulator n=1 Tax=Antarctobacter jejuensis TaxID=1439938 RepID=UPI003FD44A21
MAETPADRTSNEDIRLGPMGDSLGYLLRLAQLQAFRAFYTTFEGERIRPGEFTVLMLIAENPGIRQGVLARALMIKRAHMTKMVQSFEEAGLIRRTVPESDRRAVELWLTDAGTDRMNAFRAPFAVHEDHSAPSLAPQEAADLRRLLKKYLRLQPGTEGTT